MPGQRVERCTEVVRVGSVEGDGAPPTCRTRLSTSSSSSGRLTGPAPTASASPLLKRRRHRLEAFDFSSASRTSARRAMEAKRDDDAVGERLLRRASPLVPGRARCLRRRLGEPRQLQRRQWRRRLRRLPLKSREQRRAQQRQRGRSE